MLPIFQECHEFEANLGYVPIHCLKIKTKGRCSLDLHGDTRLERVSGQFLGVFLGLSLFLASPGSDRESRNQHCGDLQRSGTRVSLALPLSWQSVATFVFQERAKRQAG